MNWEQYVNDLWIERLIWIRQLILSVMLGLRDVSFVANRTERNSRELGQIIASVFGEEAGNTFTELLTKYRLKLTEIMTTIKSGQNTDILVEQWHGIAAETAEFLNMINPYWDKSVVERLIRDQSKLEFEFASELMKESYAQGIANFDPAYENARKAGQLMVYGIKKYLGLE